MEDIISGVEINRLSEKESDCKRVKLYCLPNRLAKLLNELLDL